MTTQTVAFSKYAYGTTEIEYYHDDISSGSTASQVIAARPGRRIRVMSLAFVCGAVGTNATFLSGGNAISPVFQNAANSGAVLPHNPMGWFVGDVGENLEITTGAGSTTGVLLVWCYT